MKILGYTIERSADTTPPAAPIEEHPEYIAKTSSLFLPPPTDKVVVNQHTSLAIAAVWRSVTLLSETVAGLPLHLISKSGNHRTKLGDHSLVSLLREPNDYTTSFGIMQHLVASCLLWGNGYLRIYRDRHYRPVELHVLMPYEVTPTLSPSRKLFYWLSNGETLPATDIIHLRGLTLDGITGISPIRAHRENIALTLYTQQYGIRFFSQGGNSGGVLKHPSKLDDKTYNRLYAQLTERMLGLQNTHKPLLLENGVSFERISIPPEDAQFLGTRQFQKSEIATLFGLPPHMIGDLTRSTNNNIEHQGMEFVIYSLYPYLRKIQLELNRKLLLEREKSDHYFLFGLNGLLRGDTSTRGDFYTKMVQNGAMSPNEVRDLEDLDRYEGGDAYVIQLNMQTMDNINKPNTDE